MWTSLGARPVAALTELLESKFDVGQMQVPIVLSLVDDLSQHLGCSVVYPLNAHVTVGMIEACSKLMHTQQLITACKSLEQNYSPLSESVVRGHPNKGMYWFTSIYRLCPPW